jgi:hypothetical protein
MISEDGAHSGGPAVRKHTVIVVVMMALVSQLQHVSAQEAGESIVVTERTVQKVESDVVGILLPGRQLTIEKVSGKWLWVKADKAGWIDRQFVKVIPKAETRLTDATAAAIVVDDRAAGSSLNRMVRSVTATAVVLDEPLPVAPPTIEPFRATRRKSHVGVMVTPRGVGVGLQWGRGRERRRPKLSIGFGFGFGGSRRGHGHHHE